jgi:ferredoxin
MIISQQKPFETILAALGESRAVFIVGCAVCATVCKSGGEEEVWQMQEALAAAGKEITGTIIIDEACHILRVSRDLRGRQQMVDAADALLVMACGAGIQSVAAAVPKKTVAALDTIFLGNIRRFGQFEQKCSLCGECILTETAGICPVTTCPKGLLNGPCGGMDEGRCETNAESECVWAQIYAKRVATGSTLQLTKTTPPKNYAKIPKPGTLTLPK